MTETRSLDGWSKRHGSTYSLCLVINSRENINHSSKKLLSAFNVWKKNGKTSLNNKNLRVSQYQILLTRSMPILKLVTSFTFVSLDQFVKTGLYQHHASSLKKCSALPMLFQQTTRLKSFMMKVNQTNQFSSYCKQELILPRRLTILLLRRRSQALTKFLWEKLKKSLQRRN